jgi:putative ABC transport system permease protein
MTRFGAGSRATLRLARRDAWRNRGRSALIALMVALPVLSISAVSVIYRSDQREARDWVSVRLGAGPQVQAWINYSGVGPITQSVDGAKYLATGGDESVTDQQHARTRVTALVPAGDQLVEDRYRDGDNTIRLGDRELGVRLREFDYADPRLRGLIQQQSGRAPRAANEVVATEALARHWHLHVGDRLDYRNLADGRTPLTVVGVVGGISVIGEQMLIGAPGTVLMPPSPADPSGSAPGNDPTSHLWLVVGPTGVNWGRVQQFNASGFVVTSRAVVADPPPASQVTYSSTPERAVPISQLGYLPKASAVGVITVAIGLILLQIALLAGPAIAVGARRNERTLALVAAGGGNRRQLRSVVLATSGVIGLVGCTAAAALGAGIGALAVPLLRRYDDQQLVRIDVHPLDLLVLIAVGSLTAIAAAMIPARQAARLDLVAVLTGRRGQGARPSRVPLIGVLVALMGCAVCYYAATRRMAFTTVVGIAVAEIGLVMVTGSILALSARGAGRLPFAARFALRDAARQRGRTAPAVAAVMAAIAGSIAVGVYQTSSNAAGQRDYRATSAIGSVEATLPAGPAAPGAADASTATVAALRRTLPVRQVAVYQSAKYVVGSTVLLYARRTSAASSNPYARGSADLYGYGRVPSGGFFDDGSALQIRIGVQDAKARAALQAGKVVVYDSTLLWPDGTVHVQIDRAEAKQGQQKESIQNIRLPAVLSDTRPGLVYPVFPPSAASALGVQLAPAGISAATSRIPSVAEQQRAAGAVNDLGASLLSVERGYHSNNPIGLVALIVAAALIALAGTFTAVGLAAAEGRSDVATLAAVGASPAVRRRLAGAQAAVITVLGAGLGLVTGLVAGWALVRLHEPALHFAPGTPASWREYAAGLGWPFTVPWGLVGLLVVGVPLLAVMIGWLSTRSRLPLVRRLGQ